MKKPNNFKQWRKVLHRTWADIGREVEAEIKYRKPRTIPRDLWKLVERARRIRLQMEACADAYETSYCEAIIEMVMRKVQP